MRPPIKTRGTLATTAKAVIPIDAAQSLWQRDRKGKSCVALAQARIPDAPAATMAAAIPRAIGSSGGGYIADVRTQKRSGFGRSDGLRRGFFVFQFSPVAQRCFDGVGFSSGSGQRIERLAF